MESLVHGAVNEYLGGYLGAQNTYPGMVARAQREAIGLAPTQGYNNSNAMALAGLANYAARLPVDKLAHIEQSLSSCIERRKAAIMRAAQEARE